MGIKISPVKTFGVVSTKSVQMLYKSTGLDSDFNFRVNGVYFRVLVSNRYVILASLFF
jgi:hypothetical protein